ncbi:MAG: hypothetical protein ACI906_002517 [Candidatus Latescibacterota bacterium]|jgi:hypothetical protein
MAVGYAGAILKDAHLAEDVAQEAFIEAYKDLTLSLCYLRSTLEPTLPDLK